jgi:L-asparaginase II
VEVVRSGLVESLHRGAVAVVREAGRLLASAGDPSLEVWLRSSAKPFQLTPFVADGGDREFRLGTRELAVAAASHSAEPFHVRTVEGMLAKGGFSVSDLRCGAHPPMREATAREMDRKGISPTAIHNNCSGKHAAMLLACRIRREDPASYDAREHPHQRRILSFLARSVGRDPESIPLGVDGCSVPLFRLSLFELALGYARLLGKRLPEWTPAEDRARREVAAAMTSAPEMVAGTGRFTTRLMRACGGALLAKEGAEAVYAMAASPRLAAALGGAVGVALKVEDGGERGRDVAAVAALAQLGLLDAGAAAALRRDATRPVLSVRGDRVGAIRPVFRLSRWGAPAG